MSYFSEISSIVTERHDAAYQSVLDTPQFVLLLGEGIAEDAGRIFRELSSRWSNASTSVFVLSVAFGASTRKPSLSTQSGLANISCQIGRQESASNRLFNLNSAIRSIVKQAAAERSLLNSHITVVGYSDDESAHFAAPSCMILNELLYNLGGTVSSRQYFCFLSEDSTRNTQSQLLTARLINMLDTQPIPTDNWFVLQENGSYRCLSCNAHIAGSRVFHQIILLGRRDSDGVVYDKNGERVALFGNLMDPKSNIRWREANTCVYTAYMYPSELDPGIDIVEAWSVLHERFAEYFASGEAISLKLVHDRIVDMLRQCQSTISAKMQGFAMYDGGAFESLRGKSSSDLIHKLQSIEKSVFGSALSNKFDYLWITQRCAAASVQAIRAWEASVQTELEHVWNEAALEGANLHIPDEKYANLHGGLGNTDKVANISDLILLIVMNLYPARNAEKAKAFLGECNDKIDTMVERRLYSLRKVRDRMNKFGIKMQIENTKEEFQKEIRRFTSANLDTRSRRAEITAEIEESDVEAYAKAISSDDYESAILNVLKKVSTKIAHSGRITPLRLEEPQTTNQKWACQFTTGLTPLQLDHGYPRIESGKGKGLYYLTRVVDIYSVTVFSSAESLQPKALR